MASFSFGTGNAAKLLRIPVYAVGRMGNALVPRGKTWVFGCAVGVADGALALHQVAQAAGHPTVWLTDSDSQDADAAALGIRAVRKSSLRGWWETARAEVVVVTHGLGDANRYAESGAFLVQLWHGIPLKRIGLDSDATTAVPNLPGAALLRRVVRALYRSTVQRICVLPAASDRSRGRLESAFALGDNRVVVTGEPRVDVLSAGTDERRRATAGGLVEKAGPLSDSQRSVLYAPTWRDGADDPAVPTAQQWIRMISVLDEHDAVLYIRSHPLGEGDYTPPLPTARVRMFGADVVNDVTPALPAFDALITDYSSLAYDVGLLAMPVLYLAPDVVDYARTRGFYGPYSGVSQNMEATDWDELLDQLAELLIDESVRADRSKQSQELSAEMHAYRDGRNAERVYQAIRARGISAPKGAR